MICRRDGRHVKDRRRCAEAFAWRSQASYWAFTQKSKVPCNNAKMLNVFYSRFFSGSSPSFALYLVTGHQLLLRTPSRSPTAERTHKLSHAQRVVVAKIEESDLHCATRWLVVRQMEKERERERVFIYARGGQLLLLCDMGDDAEGLETTMPRGERCGGN